MEPKQDTIGDIVESEKSMFLNASDKYGEFFINAAEISHLLNKFIKSVDLDHYIFALFLSQIKKHHMLALMSAVRLHKNQMGMNLRQVIEAGSWAAFAIANTGIENFCETDSSGSLSVPKKLKSKKYKWLDDNFAEGSKTLKNMKKNIDDSMAHSNIIYGHKTFKENLKENKFEIPFFDYEDDFHVKTDLWQIANIGYGLMDLFYGINKKYGGIVFADDFLTRIRELINMNEQLKLEMVSSDKFKAIKGPQI